MKSRFYFDSTQEALIIKENKMYKLECFKIKQKMLTKALFEENVTSNSHTKRSRRERTVFSLTFGGSIYIFRLLYIEGWISLPQSAVSNADLCHKCPLQK